MTTKLLKCTLTDKNEIMAYVKFYDFDNKSESELEKSILKEAQTIESAEDLFKLLLETVGKVHILRFSNLFNKLCTTQHSVLLANIN